MNQTRRKKRMHKRIRIIRFWTRNLMVILLFFVTILLARKVFASEKKSSQVQEQKVTLQQNKDNNTETTKPLDQYKAQNKKDNKETHSEHNKEVIELYKKNEALLTLVNKEHVCPEQLFPLRKICNGRLEAADILYSDLCQMLEDGSKMGYSFWIASAYRSADKQQALVNEDVANAMKQGLSYEDALAKTYEETMPAGCSEHQTGLALDILSSENMQMDISQETTPGNQWLQEHCYEYGFILRYPKDKVEITKISYEPWHFRYVGKQAAKYMKNNDLTLEEFYLKLGEM